VTLDLEKVRTKIQFIRDSLRQLEEIRARGEEEFLSDPILQGAALRSLQVAIQAVLDTANHIVAREGLGIPKAYRDSLEMLVKQGVLPREGSEPLLRMVSFRNRIVHLYESVDPPEVWAILKGHLQDFDIFLKAIAQRYFSR
jgi:uncharacterized protein YutE (UPF0331/DUF86 family)